MNSTANWFGRPMHPSHFAAANISVLESSDPIHLPILQRQTQESSRLLVNHCTPYTYIHNCEIFPANHCPPSTYIKNSAGLPVNYCTPYAYPQNCATCITIHRQHLHLPHHQTAAKNPAYPSPSSLRGHRQTNSNPRLHTSQTPFTKNLLSCKPFTQLTVLQAPFSRLAFQAGPLTQFCSGRR